MEIKDYKKTKQQQVWDILDKQGYILDNEAMQILGEKWRNIEEYKRQWKRLRADENFFKDKKIIGKEKGYRCHLVKLENGDYYKVGKEFYNTII